MMNLYKNIIWWEKVWEFWSRWAKTLPQKENIFQVSDFDYTLFSRDEQLNDIADLQNNRGDLWPQYLFETYGMSQFLEKYYTYTPIPQWIIEKLDSSRDIIMTAGGSKDFQIAKVRSCKELDDFKVIVTPDGENKVSELIRYVLFELRYIPKEIIVYEDRPHYFIQYRELIEWILWCKLIIMFVEMNENKGYIKIEKVKI